MLPMVSTARRLLVGTSLGRLHDTGKLFRNAMPDKYCDWERLPFDGSQLPFGSFHCQLRKRFRQSKQI